MSSDLFFATKAIQNHIFLPPDPLGELLLTSCHDVDSLNDNTVVLGDTVYCLNPTTGRYEPFTVLDAKPDNSDGAIKMPVYSARQVLELYKSYPGIPVPMQLRSYTRAQPGKDQAGWTANMHIRHTQFNTASFSNMTASGIDNDDAVPMVNVPFRHQGFVMLNRDIPGYYERNVNDEQPFGVTYLGAPGLDDNAKPSTGCEELYGLFTTALQRSGDGGATWANVTTGVTITAGGTIGEHNGRLIMAVGTAIYYSDKPNGGATEWRTATISGVTPTTLGVIASNGSDVFIVYNTSGVLRSSDNGRTWTPVVGDLVLTSSAINDLGADGSVVVAAAVNDVLLVSISGGDSGSWELLAGPGAATDDYFGAAVARWNLTDSGSVIIYLASDDGTDRTIFRSEDRGNSWEELLTIAGASGTTPCQIKTAVDSWVVYVNTDALTYKSVDGGRTWDNISNDNVDATQGTRFSLCRWNPNEVFVIGNSHT